MSEQARLGLSRMHYPVTVLGYGTRAGVWTQGCSIGCLGCISRDTWEPAVADQLVDIAELLDWIASCGPVDGLTVSGGEPFEQPEALTALLTGFRDATDNATTDVLLYSGFSAARVQREFPDICGLVDAVMTGPFVRGLPGDSTKGSGNQQLLTMTDLGRQRYRYEGDEAGQSGIQVAASGGSLWMIGIPVDGDMDQMQKRLAVRGVELSDVSWRC